MADRYPLIFDLSDNKFKELIPGDNLDFTGSGIVNADFITTDGIILGRPRYNVYSGNAVTGSVLLTASDINKVILVNTSSACTINLPQGSTLEVGDFVRVIDVGNSSTSSGNSEVNPVTISPFTGDKVMGSEQDLQIDANGHSVAIMWCGSTFNWRIVN